MMNDDNRIFELQGKLDKLNMDMDYLRRRCSESARFQFDIGVYGLLHIVTDEELKNNDKVREMLIKSEQKAQERISELQSKLEELNNKVDSVKKSKYEMLDKFRKEMEPYKDLKKKYERIKELESELEVKDNLLKNQEKLCGNYNELPCEPISVAEMLINAKIEYEPNSLQKKLFKADGKCFSDKYSDDDLEQIAEHLLVYCKHHREDE